MICSLLHYSCKCYIFITYFMYCFYDMYIQSHAVVISRRIEPAGFSSCKRHLNSHSINHGRLHVVLLMCTNRDVNEKYTEHKTRQSRLFNIAVHECIACELLLNFITHKINWVIPWLFKFHYPNSLRGVQMQKQYILFIYWRYLQFKLLKCKEMIPKCDTFDHTSKYISICNERHILFIQSFSYYIIKALSYVAYRFLY